MTVKDSDPFGFAQAVQVDHLTAQQVDLVEEILNKIK